jgi:hypothetical protein
MRCMVRISLEVHGFYKEGEKARKELGGEGWDEGMGPDMTRWDDMGRKLNKSSGMMNVDA